MSKQTLNHLTFLSIEYTICGNVDFECLIQDSYEGNNPEKLISFELYYYSKFHHQLYYCVKFVYLQK